jgi:hypothetical protein
MRDLDGFTATPSRGRWTRHGSVVYLDGVQDPTDLAEPGVTREELALEAPGRGSALVAPATRSVVMGPLTVVEPQPIDYADMARQILRGRKGVGIVLSVVGLLPADGQPMIDTRTEKGNAGPRLKNPPAHVHADVYGIEWKGIRVRYVWIRSHPKVVYQAGGLLFLPSQNQRLFYLVTFNVGALDARTCTNVHHAEMQAVHWVKQQPPRWQSRIGAIAIWNRSRRIGLGYSPCNYCCSDLMQFLTYLRALNRAAHVPAARAWIRWLTLYRSKSRFCGYGTDSANLRNLHASGWYLEGQGWTPPKPVAPITARRPGPTGGQVATYQRARVGGAR